MEQIAVTLQRINKLLEDKIVISQLEKDLLLQHTRVLYEQLYALEVSNIQDTINDTIANSLIQDSVVKEPADVVLGENDNFEIINAETDTESDEILLTVEDELEECVDDIADSFLDCETEIETTELELNERTDLNSEDEQVEFVSEIVDKDGQEILINTDVSVDELTETVVENTINQTSLPSIEINGLQNITQGFKVWQKDIRTFIGINDKYNFISELFKSNSEAYEEVLNEINNSENKEEAKLFLENSGITTLYNWQQDGFSEQIFYNILSQFFASR